MGKDKLKGKPRPAQVVLNYLREKLEGAAVLLYISLFLASVAIPSYQTFHYLRSGMWEPLPIGLLVLALPPTSEFREWYVYPRSWFGLHEIVVAVLKVPISLVCFVGAVAAWILWERLQPPLGGTGQKS